VTEKGKSVFHVGYQNFFLSFSLHHIWRGWMEGWMDGWMEKAPDFELEVDLGWNRIKQMGQARRCYPSQSHLDSHG
jgi:hypothetical protein